MNPDNTQLLAEAITDKVAKRYADYTQDDGCKGLNMRGEVYAIVKEILDEGVDVIL